MAAEEKVNANTGETTTATIPTVRSSNNLTIQLMIRSLDLGSRLSRSIPDAVDVFGDCMMDGITNRRRVPLGVQSLFPLTGGVTMRPITSVIEELG